MHSLNGIQVSGRDHDEAAGNGLGPHQGAGASLALTGYLIDPFLQGGEEALL